MSWVGGLAEWDEGETIYLSVAFTYKLNEAFERAQRAKFFGRKVVVGGPAVFLMREGKMHHPISLIATIGDSYPDALFRHNPEATIASRGCPVGCHFCIVPTAMLGLKRNTANCTNVKMRGQQRRQVNDERDAR